MHRAVHRVCVDHHVQHNFEVLGMQLIEDRAWIGEDFLVEVKLAVVGVPARRAEAGAQVDHSVAGQLLFAKCFRFGKNLLAAGERTVRLLVAQAPQRRHFRKSRQPGIFGQDRGGFVRRHQENIER